MGSSLRLRSAELLAARDIVGECRELGDDCITWRRHYFQRLGNLVGGELIMGGELTGCRSRNLVDLGTTTYGFENGFNQTGWQESLGRLKANPAEHLQLQRFCQRYDLATGSCFERAELIRDCEWYRSDEYVTVNRVIGIDQCLQCYVAIPNSRDDHCVVVLGRAFRRRPFNAREKHLVLHVQKELRPWLGGALARFTEPNPSDLSRRPRQVLKLLLEGEGDKQIAWKLGISTYTVNQYVKMIFAHFGVSSRPELLARWLRRGWNNRAVWAE